jgi:hypothetical protein
MVWMTEKGRLDEHLDNWLLGKKLWYRRERDEFLMEREKKGQREYSESIYSRLCSSLPKKVEKENNDTSPLLPLTCPALHKSLQAEFVTTSTPLPIRPPIYPTITTTTHRRIHAKCPRSTAFDRLESTLFPFSFPLQSNGGA